MLQGGRFATIALAAWLGVGCSSSSSSASGQDASIDDGGVPPASDVADGRAAEASATRDASAGDPGDATVQALSCPSPTLPRWDGGRPDGAVCGDLFADTDRDSYPDCFDGCPYDPAKIAPGTCGCGTADTDTDGDGVPDCIDRCPLDPNNQGNDQCGCVHSVILEPSGSACTDTACAQSDASCNGSGVCGDRSGCSPCAGGRYVEAAENDIGYWLCGGIMPPAEGPGCVWEDGGEGAGATRSAAQAACASRGMTLARIETLTENRDLARLITTRVWIGANDLQTPGQWYWSSPSSESDALFWSGGADGGPQNSMFSDWGAGAPAAQRCASMTPDGLWYDTDCSETLAYVCEFRATLR